MLFTQTGKLITQFLKFSTMILDSPKLWAGVIQNANSYDKHAAIVSDEELLGVGVHCQLHNLGHGSDIWWQRRYWDLPKYVPSFWIYKKEGDIFIKVSNDEMLTKHYHHHKAIHSLGRDDDWVLADWLEDTTARECPSSNKSWLLALPEQDGSQALDRE